MSRDISARLDELLTGRLPQKVELEGLEAESRRLAERINRLIDFVAEIHDFILPLSKGELQNLPKLRRDNYLASPFKELHSRLVHLTWQAEQVARGDYGQRVDFMGDFSKAFNAMVIALDKNEKALQQKIAELEGALSHINKLEGLLPICSNCKRVRLQGSAPDNEGGWVVLEQYIEDRSEAKFTHSICPQCVEKLYPDLAKDMKKGGG